MNPERISEANDNARKSQVTDRVKFEVKNLFEAGVRQATLVTLYLLPDVNLRLRPRLLRELKVGSRIVSHSFDMGEWKPYQKLELNGKTLYLWEVTEKAKAQFAEPEKAAGVDGEWVYSMQSPMGEVKAALTLKSEGGQVTGFFLFPENRKLEITEGQIQGDELSMVVKRDRASGGTMVYRMKGKVSGGSIEGKATTEMDGQPSEMSWSAKRK